MYASFIAETVRELGDAFDRTCRKILEYRSRLLEHQKQLSGRFNDIAEIIDEASFWAFQDGNGLSPLRCAKGY